MMNSFFLKSCKLLFILMVLSSVSFAQNISDALRLAMPGLGSNARSLGMGNSYIALSDDASASFFNPAGFGLLKRIEFSGGLSYTNFDNTNTLLGQESDYSNSATRLNRISFAFPFPTTRGSLVFGFSYHDSKDLTNALKFDALNPTSSYINYETGFESDVIYNLGLSRETNDGDFTPIGGGLQQSGNTLADGSIRNWTFSGAIEIHKNLFFGANLNIISGSYRSNSDFFEDDINGLYQDTVDPGDARTLDFVTFHENRILDWDISGWDAKLGFLYQFKNNARVGVTVQLPRTYTINEVFDLSGESFFGSNNSPDPTFVFEASDEVEYDIVTPFEIGAGFSLNLFGLIVSAQGTVIDYSQTEFDGEGAGLSLSRIESLNKAIKEDLRAVVNYNIGAEYTIPEAGVRVRAGYMVNPSAYQDDPGEFDRKFVAAGIGFLADETVALDLGYAYGWWEDFTDNYGSNFSRNFQDITYNKFILSGTYRF